MSEADVGELLNRLKIEDDDIAVVSFAAHVEDNNPTRLMFASVLFGPAQMAQMSWLEWSAQTQAPAASVLADLENAGRDLCAARSFVRSVGSCLLGRVALTPDNAVCWLAGLLAGEPAELVEDVVLHAHAIAASGAVRTFPNRASPAGRLAGAVERPVTGYFFPIELGTADVGIPDRWGVGDLEMDNASFFLLGLPSAADETSVKPGIYIGSIERRAWIARSGIEDEGRRHRITLCIDADRIGLADIEVSVEEYLEAELCGARRLRLDDLVRPASMNSIELYDVVLPSRGPRLARQVWIHDHNGTLLDCTDRQFSVESVQIGLIAEGMGFETVTAGNTAPPPALLERLLTADTVEDEFRQLLEAGLPGRIIDDPTKALPRLTTLLGEAIGDLSILDPYFGHDVQDWQVFAAVSVNVRVLTGHGNQVDKHGQTVLRQRVKSPPPGTVGPGVSLDVRSWRPARVPWHDRVYLWANGGLSVGTSPSGLGGRVARIDRLTAVEALGWQRMFDSWWASTDVAPI